MKAQKSDNEVPLHHPPISKKIYRLIEWNENERKDINCTNLKQYLAVHTHFAWTMVNDQPDLKAVQQSSDDKWYQGAPRN